MSAPQPVVAFDIGGTFTDIVTLQSDGSISTAKVRSDPDLLVSSVGQTIEEALSRSGERELGSLLHATTIASNALLEGKGARIGLLTTRGFRDELEIRREARPAIYDFSWNRSQPLIPRRRRLEVTERIDARGHVKIPLDGDDVRAALEVLKAEGIEAIAICFINSHKNAAHEEEAKSILEGAMPGLVVCASHEVLPEIREYERCSTTTVNAYLMPTVQKYLSRIEKEVSDRAPSLRIMQSNGGMMTEARARRLPVRMVESGPAAGVLAAAALTREIGVERAVAFDMGGTTVKACLIEDSAPVERFEHEVGGEANISARYNHGAGYSISAPSFDIVEVGAGGGSIARMHDGLLRVGPTSAGAVPGPVAYGNGGSAPTVTDANVVLGYINPRSVAGGTVKINAPAARNAIEVTFRGLIPGSIQSIAYGIFQVANAAMMRSIRAVTTERGRDPRSYALISFGGSGPVHAAALAEMLGMETVYVPPLPGLFSAIGLLLADLRYDLSESWQACLDDAFDAEDLVDTFDRLTEQVCSEGVKEGFDPTDVRVEWFVDLRYRGQSSEMTVRMPDPQVQRGNIVKVLVEDFHTVHHELYGYRQDGEEILITNLRVRAFAKTRTTNFAELAEHFHGQSDLVSNEESTRPAFFGSDGGAQETRVLTRSALLGGPCQGPAIIDEFSTTVVIPPGWSASLDAIGNIVLKHSRV
jgi:N-methylhydantoinase A